MPNHLLIAFSLLTWKEAERDYFGRPQKTLGVSLAAQPRDMLGRYGALFTYTLLLNMPGVAENASPPRRRKRGLLAEESNGLTNEAAL